MSTYKTKSGATLTDDEIERLGEAAERGEYPGTPGEFIVSATSQRVLSDVVEQPFAHAPKDGLLHDSDLLGETLT